MTDKTPLEAGQIWQPSFGYPRGIDQVHIVVVSAINGPEPRTIHWRWPGAEGSCSEEAFRQWVSFYHATLRHD
jgi:hypothetical protein